MLQTPKLLSGIRKFKWEMKPSRTRRVNVKKFKKIYEENDQILKKHNIFNLKKLPKVKEWDPYHHLKNKQKLNTKKENNQLNLDNVIYKK